MINNSPIRVLIVDDSLVFCKFLSLNLPKINPRIKIIGYFVNPADALNKIPILKPDVITLDVEMPQMNGIEFLKILMKNHPTPVVLSSSLSINVFDVMSYGAIDFVKKPDLTVKNSSAMYVNFLASKIAIASTANIKKSTQIPNKIPQTPQNNGSINTITIPNIKTNLSHKVLKINSPNSLKVKGTVIAIGASTGGTEATLEILKRLPENIPPIVVTQHMPEGFTNMYANRLNKICAMEIREAKDGDIVQQGLCLIAPGGDYHMKLERCGINYCVRLVNTPKVNGHKPSVDVLFESVADVAKSNSIGIILTGMGNDGAKGLLKMRQSKAFTIGQNKSTSIVYGMPMEAYNIGAVCKQVSLTSIADVLINHINSIS